MGLKDYDMKPFVRHFFLLITLILPVCSSEAVVLPDSVSRLLDELDEVIVMKSEYLARRFEKIRTLEQRALPATDNQKYLLYDSLYTLYLHFQADSALSYIHRKEELLPRLDNAKLWNEIFISRAEVMGVMGMYGEALAELAKINPALLPADLLSDYYYTYRTCYGWAAENTAVRPIRRQYEAKTNAYRDSILTLLPESMDRDITFCEKLILKHQPDKAIRLLQQLMQDSTDGQRQIYLHYTLSKAYQAKRDTVQRVYHLAHTAMLDIRSAVREYVSLPELAIAVYELGDLERSYRYLNCSMEDAVACNARLRFMEVTAFYPIIDRAYKAQENQRKELNRMLLISVSSLAVLLVIALCYLYYWMKKISMMRRHLYQANKKLVEANATLKETGKIKEVYIARYLDRCVFYLDKLEQYRRSLEKLAMASKIDELFKAIRSEQFLRDERKAFYNEFDKSFLDLFPTFIEDFNKLLTDEGKVYPKPGELLNTELRIFALIRLGVTDSNRITHFLGYSLATVYNYRSKIRNKAVGDKEEFESLVMKL